MEHFEMVEKLSQKANVSLARAKEVLEKHNWDMLDAMIELENTKEAQPEKAEYSTQNNPAQETAQPVHNTASDKDSFCDIMRRFCRWCGNIIHKGMKNELIVDRKGEQLMAIPMTVLAIVLILGFWIILPLLVVGLFLDCRYHVEGRELGKPAVNEAMNKVSEMAEEIKAKVSESGNK